MVHTEEIIYKNRMLILFNVVLLTFMATLDSSIVNVALPKMAANLAVTTEAISWVVSSYLIAISGTILIFGRLGDILGKTKVFQLGVLLFTFGSLICMLSHSFFILIAARVVQAIGAAGSMATSQGIITQVFPAHERGRALGINGTFVALGSMVGPSLGGLIVGSFSWQYIFMINIPIGIIVSYMGLKILPKTEFLTKEKLDAQGGILLAVSITALFLTLTWGEEIGYTHFAILFGLAISAICFIIFIVTERKIEMPLIRLEIFKDTLFSLSIFCAFTTFVAISVSNIILPFYFQNTLNMSSSQAGLLLMVSPIVMSVVAPLSGALSDKIGSEFLTFVGLTICSTGLFLMSQLNQFSSITTMIVFMAIMSAGNALFQSPNTSLIMSSVGRNMLGIAGSVNALIRNLGFIFGITLSVTILYSQMSNTLGFKVSDYVQGHEEAFIYGMKSVYIAAGMICVLGMLLTAFRLMNKRRKNEIDPRTEQAKQI